MSATEIESFLSDYNFPDSVEAQCKILKHIKIGLELQLIQQSCCCRFFRNLSFYFKAANSFVEKEKADK